MDFGAPVANNITPPNPNQSIQTLSGLVGIQQQEQALQQGQQQLQIGQATAQSAQQQMDERQLLQRSLASGKDPDGNSLMNPDGSANAVSMAAFANKHLPLTGQAVVQNIVKTQADQLTLADATRSLGNSEKNDLSGIVRSAIGSQNPADVISQGFAAYAKQNPNAASVVDAAQPFIPHLNGMTPQQQGMALTRMAQYLQPPATTAQEQAPQQAIITGPNGGAQAVQTNPLSGVPQGATGPEVAQGIPLSERSTVGVNALTGGPTVINKNGAGQFTGITNAPTQGVYVPQPGDPQALPVLQGERDAARVQYSSAPSQHTNNQIVLDNIDNVAATGPLGMKARNLLSAYGVNANSDAATAYDLVGKGLERSALQAAQSMGPGTNAGLEAQIKANGSTAYTPTAIKEITKLNDALVSGTQAYQPGLERAIAANPSAGVFAKRQYDEAWGANFDPKIFEMYNAAKSGDSAKLNSIITGLGGKNSPQFKALMQKATNLNQLSNGGSLQ